MKKKNCFVEPFLPYNNIGIIHLASKIKGDNYNLKSIDETVFDIRTTNNNKVKKNIRFVI